VKFHAPAAGQYGSNLLFALKVKDKGGLKKSAKSAVFVQESNSKTSPFTVTPSLSLFEKGKYYQARASVVLIDDLGAVVKNAEVNARWSLPGSNTEYSVFGYTTGAGEAKWDSERFTDKGTIKFTVNQVSIDGELYGVNIVTTLTLQ
jgi:hypothetical protein